jgi:N-methylhydantoinase A
MTAGHVLGIDIGGTFTDVVALDAERGALRAAKAPTTSGRLVEGILASLAALELDLGGVSRILHGSTICTNALIERTHARTGFIGTKGFADEFEIQRMVRRWARTPWAAIYDLHQRKPPPFVPRHLRREVNERTLHTGTQLTPLDEEELEARAAELVEAGVEAIGVCFLWSTANPEHERRAKRALERAHPGLRVAISADVAPVVREYERMVTTAVNASLMPVMSDYLESLGHELADHGFRGELAFIQSSGGLADPDLLGVRPILTLRSGPVAGAVAAARLARALDRRRAISCDIGGTSCDTAVILDFEVPVTDATEVDYYPVRVPTADVRCIGSGGGSVAALDAGGALRVGPESTGSAPGPACYGRGGERPTLTDANLLLGRLGPGTLAAGGISLDEDRARRAIEPLATALRRDVRRAAHGVVSVAVARMAEELRLQTVDRGHDPRDFALIAFGGAGPLHATLLAEACAIPEVIVPVQPGVLSSLGMVMADPSVSGQVGFLAVLDGVTAGDLARALDTLEEEGRAALASARDRVVCRRSAAMRYVLQEWELRVALPEGPIDDGSLELIARAFHEAHLARYGFAREDQAVEFVTLYVDAVARAPAVELGRVEQGSGDPARALKERREVYLDERHGTAGVPVYERDRLRAGDILPGPLVVEEGTATTYVQPGWLMQVDAAGNLVAAVERSP